MNGEVNPVHVVRVITSTVWVIGAVVRTPLADIRATSERYLTCANVS